MRARKLWIGSLFGLAALAPVSAVAQDLASPKWTPWVEFGGVYGSNDTSRGEAVLWVPLAQGQTSVLFGEARGKLFENDMREGNFALGYRQMQASGWNIGVWGGYDIRRSEFGNTFRQLAGGIEALSDRWDFRANAYLPLNDSENVFTATALASNSVVELSGNQIGMVTTVTSTTTTMEELALWGFDAEIGAKIFSTPLDLSGPHHELRLYAGAYHFDHSDLPSSVTGPRVRAEWRMDDVIDQWAGSRLTLEAEYSHDQLRDDRVEVGARLRLPFGDNGTRVASRSLTAQERRMADGLERDTDIVTDTNTTSSSTTSTATEAVEDAVTGTALDQVVTIDNTSNIGTVSASAGANTLIIADGTAGAFTGQQNIQSNQTVLGGGNGLAVRGRTSGQVAIFTAPGSTPTLFVPGTDHVRVEGSNTHIAGLNVDGLASNGSTLIVATGFSNVAISDSSFQGVTGGYYALTTSSSTLIQRISISAASNGIAVMQPGIDVTIEDSEIAVSTATAFGMFDGNVNGTGNTGSAPVACLGIGQWGGSIEFNGVMYSSGVNC